MSKVTAQKQHYRVSVYEPEEPRGVLLFTFVPNGIQHERGAGGTPKRVPQFIVSARQHEGELTFDWSETPDDPGAERDEIQMEIAVRMQERTAWVNRVTSLLGQVEQWAEELGWATRRIEKQLDDSRIGKHQVPALLMQEGTCRLLLEPIGRSMPGAEGLVDLYRMPAYDDIASLYFYEDRWNLHFPASDSAGVPVRQVPGEPLSRETLRKALEEMKRNAA
jgi:hypothetical protein